MKIEWKGKEVKNPILRILLGFIGIVVAILGIVVSVLGIVVTMLGIVVVIFVIVLIMATSPIWLIIHLILKVSGRKGFIKRGLSIKFDNEAFKKQ